MTSDDVKMESVNKCCGHERKYWSLQWMFCPFCGTPKPVEKELAEKLYIAWFNLHSSHRLWKELSGESKDDWRQIAYVATEHFKEKP